MAGWIDLPQEEKQAVRTVLQRVRNKVSEFTDRGGTINGRIGFDVILVGSWAVGYARPISDLDIVILCEHTFDQMFTLPDDSDVDVADVLQWILKRPSHISDIDRPLDISFRSFLDMRDRDRLPIQPNAPVGFSLLDGTVFNKIADIRDKYWERAGGFRWRLKQGV